MTASDADLPTLSSPPGPAFARRQLRALLAEHGQASLDDPRRFEALLRDLCGESRREAHILVSALRERIAAELLAPTDGLPRSLLVARLAQRMHDNLGTAESFARWAVVSWALALGVMTDREAAVVEATPPSHAPPDDMTPTLAAVVVDARGRGDYIRLQDALADVAPFTRILVTPGEYRERLIVDRPLEIVGDGLPHQIIIHGVTLTAAATLRALTFERHDSARDDAVVDIRAGRIVVEDCVVIGGGRAGIAVGGRDSELIGRRLRVADALHTSLLFHDEARGAVEDSDIDHSGRNGVHITGDANPLLRRCQLRRGREIGLLVDRGGRGVLEDCDIVDNQFQGVIISGGGPVLTRCRIQRNDIGVWVERGGHAVVERCDLRGNRVSAWRVRAGASVQRRGNRE